MKMSILDRLFLTVQTLFIILLSVAIIGISIGAGINLIPLSRINTTLRAIQLDWKFFLIASLVSALFIIVSTKLLFAGAKPKLPSSSLIKHTELGMIRVSINALEIMTQKAARSFDQVKDVRINIITEEGGIKVQLKVFIMPDVILPELTVSLQQRVKEYIESYSGIIVKEVFIYVDNISTPQQRSKVH